MKKLSGILVVAGLALLFDGCKKDEKTVSPPVPGNEFLTTVQLIAINAADPSDMKTVAVKQLPDQPVDYSNATLNLKKNAVYNVQVKFLDETTSPAGDVTEDIYERRNYHLICFTISGAALTVQRTDKDTNTPALEIGLQDAFTTAGASSGALNVQLRHQPNAKNGSCDPGSSDADVTFPVNIN
jgi:hypothetical protein